MAAALVSCGSNNSSSSSSTGAVSGLSNRALVSNSIASSTFPTLVFILDAKHDKFTRFSAGAGQQPGIMTLSGSRNLMLVASAADNLVALLDNTKERTIAGVGLAVGAATSMVFGPGNTTAYVAVPLAPVLNGPNGVVLVLDIDQSTRRYTVASRIPVAGVNQLEVNATASRIVALGSTNTAAVIDTSKVSIKVSDNTAATTFISGFDKAVDATFSSDGNTAYVYSCGAECGGTQASVSTVDMTAYHINATQALNAATAGYLSSGNLYVAGSKPGTTCKGTTAAANCGEVNVVDANTLAVKQGPIEVTDGFHNHIELQSGKLFVGAKRCSNVNSSTETRGCLSILDTTANTAVVSPDLGDVTGIAPIGGGRTVVYVVIGGQLRIYDAKTSALIDSNSQLDIVGDAVDVKYIDK